MRRPWIERLEPPFLDVHAARWVSDDAIEIRDDARRFETWEHSVANRLGLGAAVDYALAIGIDAIEERVTMLGDALRERLGTLPGVTLRDLGTRRCGIVAFTVDDEDPFALAARLRAEAINISVSTIDFARFDLGCAWPRRGRACVGALLQHRRRARPPRRRGRAWEIANSAESDRIRIHCPVSPAQRDNPYSESGWSAGRVRSRPATTAEPDRGEERGEHHRGGDRTGSRTARR